MNGLPRLQMPAARYPADWWFWMQGHGGKDPGKVGREGQLEKEINLQIVLRLKTYLEMNDIQVVLTREDDNGLYRFVRFK